MKNKYQKSYSKNKKRSKKEHLNVKNDTCNKIYSDKSETYLFFV